MTTIRLVNAHRKNHGEWFVGPDDEVRLAYCIKLLAEYRAAEPDADWHLEIRGLITTWYRMEVPE